MAAAGRIDPQAGHRILRTSVWSCIALLAALALCYANAYDASWQYDDYPNIVENEKIRVTQWSWSQFRGSFSAGLDHQTVSRPLAYLSFALNHRLGERNVVGYRLSNFAIHWLSAVFLFLFLRKVMRLPRFGGRYDEYADLTALMAAMLWATHPIQVTAVTYVVQRMASMAGLFYVMTLFFYLKGRTASGPVSRWGFLSLGALTALCGLLTKENTVLVFYAIWLFDLLLLQDRGWRRLGRNLLWVMGFTVAIAFVGTLYTDPRNLFQPYEMRPYTWLERLMTQPRVFFFYLTLIAVPMTSRMSMLHDIEVSRSLWMPWTTAASVAGLILVIAGLILAARRYPLPAYCGLFFFLNHAIEGSIFNLELIYEHRNYIPSMLFFLPVSIWAVSGARRIALQGKYPWIAVCLVLMLTASQIHATITYNRAFLTKLALWSDVVVKYPRLSLGHLNLGNVYWAAGQFARSAERNRMAVELDRFNNRYQKGLAYFNLGLYAAQEQKDHALALDYFDKARQIYDQLVLLKKISRVWMQQGEHRLALTFMKEAERQWGDDGELLRMMGVSSLKLARYDEARALAREALIMKDNDAVSLIVVAQSHRLQGDGQSALKIFKQLLANDPQSILGILALIEIYDELEHQEKAVGLVDRLMARLPPGNIGAKRANLRLELEPGQQEMMPYVPDMNIIGRLLAYRTDPGNNRGMVE